MNEKLTQKIQRDFDRIALCEQAWESRQAYVLRYSAVWQKPLSTL